MYLYLFRFIERVWVERFVRDILESRHVLLNVIVCLPDVHVLSTGRNYAIRIQPLLSSSRLPSKASSCHVHRSNFGRKSTQRDLHANNECELENRGGIILYP